MVDYHNKIYMGSLSGLVLRLVTLVTSIATVPLFIGAVGIDLYGLYIIVSLVVGFVAIGDFGITAAVKNKIAYFHADENYYSISKLFYGSGIFFVGSIILVSLFIAFVFFLGDSVVEFIFGFDESVLQTGLYIFIITLFFASINAFLGGIVRTLFHGLNKIARYDAVVSVVNVISALAFILFLLFSPSIVAIAFFQGFIIVFRVLALYLYAKYLFSWLQFAGGFKSVGAVIPLMRYSLEFFWLSFLTSLIKKSDMLVLSHFLGVGSAAIYNVNDKILGYPTGMLRVTDSALPSIAILYHKKKFKRLRELYENILRMNLIVKLVPLLFILVYSKEILTLWVGADFFVGYPLMLAFFVSYLIYGWVGPHFVFINAMFKHKKVIVPMTLNVFINLSLSILFVMKYGLIGVVLGTVIANFVTSAFYIPILLRRILNVDPLKIFLRLLVSFIPSIVLLLSLYYVNVYYIETLVWQIIFAAFVFLLYVFVSFWVILVQRERRFILGRLKEFVPLFRKIKLLWR